MAIEILKSKKPGFRWKFECGFCHTEFLAEGSDCESVERIKHQHYGSSLAETEIVATCLCPLCGLGTTTNSYVYKVKEND